MHKNNKPIAKPDSQKKFKSYWSANPFKIYSHIPKLYEWYMGNDIYPISIEIGITSQCNHNCCWCSITPKKVDRHSYLSKDILKKFVSNVKEMNVRSVVISGSGEQTLHKDLPWFLQQLHEAGLYIGMNTNGSRLTPDLCRTIVDTVTWIRISLDAASEEVRKAVHGVKDLNKATEGLKELVRLKKEVDSQISIGTQMVVCPENEKEIESCTNLSIAIGVDYQQIKPAIPFDYYYPNYKDAKIRMAEWLDRIKNLDGNKQWKGFQVNVRYDQFENYINGTDFYERVNFKCLTSFSPYIEADGNVWYCVDKKGNENYWLGDLNNHSLKEIWESERRKEVLYYTNQNPCGHICRNSPLNELLWEMKNPTPFYSFL
ncbi:MAG: radical SAM protein [Deltaproteobacteria bacterium]|nr:radical SAM protein [Deltaproteobacteria bacterium]